MKLAYHDGRLFAIVAALICISSTLAILLNDVWNGAPFTLKHWMAVAVLMCAVLFGHIAKKVSWLDPKKYGFWLLFWACTALVAYSSIGRQSETMTISAAQAEADGEMRRDTKTALASNKAMLTEANARLAKECASGAGKRCAGIEKTIKVYTDAIAGNEAALARLGPAKPVAANADKLAEVTSLFGYDAKHVKTMAVVFEPIAYFAVLEYGSILTISLALGGGQKKRATASLPQPTPSKSVDVSASVPSLAAEMLAHAPVSVKDSQQSSFQTPPAREHKQLIAAGLLTADGEVPFKTPPRWTYEKDLN